MIMNLAINYIIVLSYSQILLSKNQEEILMKKLKSFGAALVSFCLILSTVTGIGLSSAALDGMEADIINVDFSDGSAANKVTTEGFPVLTENSGATVQLTPDLVLGRKVATFDGTSGFGYTLTEDALNLITENGYTVEIMVKSTDTSSSGYAYGDMYNVSGMGLEINSENVITSYQKNDSNDNYRQCWYDATAASYNKNEWMHIIVTCDPKGTGGGVMYVNGQKYDYYSQTAGYTLTFPNDVEQVLYLGGNAKNGAFAEGMKGSIAYFRMYSHPATEEEAAALYNEEAAGLADIFCVDYSTGLATQSVSDGPALINDSGNTATYVDDETLGRKVASFDGLSGFGYTMKEEDYAKMSDGYTFETLFRFNELPAVTNEYGSSVIGCMNEGKGFGLMGTAGNSLQYWFGKKDADGNYRQLWLDGAETTPTAVSEWIHVIVTYDSGTYYYYVNGEKNDYVSPGELGYLADPANILYVGGAPDADGSFRIGMKGDVSYVKLYSSAKTEEEITALYENAITAGTSNPSKESGGEEGSDVSHTNSKGEEFNAEFDSENVIINFAAMSDIHIKTSSSVHDGQFVNSLTKAKELAGGSDNLAAVLVAGDLGDASPLAEYARIKQFLDENLNPETTAFLPTIGNHDYYFEGAFSGRNSFRDILGEYVYSNPIPENTEAEITRGNYHTIINGIHFISVFGMDGNHDYADVNWLDEQLALAEKDTPDMPIIVYSHVQAANTVIDDEDDPTETRWYSTTIGSTLEKYSNVVYFAGHTHATADIWNDGSYTAVGTGCIEKNMMFVQIDGNGAVRIAVYPTNTDIAEMDEMTKLWTFDTKAYTGSTDDGNDNDNNNNNNNNTNDSENNGSSDNDQNGVKDDQNSEMPTTGQKLSYFAVALVCLSGISMVVFRKLRTFPSFNK